MKKEAIIVSSCDLFQDAWALFFYFFFKQWPDCEYPIYFITNHGIYEDERVNCIPVGRDRGWASNLMAVLKQLDVDSILYMQEDYFLNRRVDNEKIRESFAFAQACNATYLGLYPIPVPDEASYEGHPSIGRLSSQARMRASLQAAIWSRSGLMDLLVEGEDGWAMEKEGTERSRSDLFLRYNAYDVTPLDYLFTAIKRGAWNPEALSMCENEGLNLPMHRRGLMPESKKVRFFRRLREKFEQRLASVYKRKFTVHPLCQK